MTRAESWFAGAPVSLNEEEISRVGGGLHTETVCTVPSTACANKDGDASIGECGPVCQ